MAETNEEKEILAKIEILDISKRGKEEEEKKKVEEKEKEEKEKEKEEKEKEKEGGEKTEDRLTAIREVLKGNDLKEKTAQWVTECDELRSQLDLLWGEMRGIFREWWRTEEFGDEGHKFQHHQARIAVVITALGEIPELVKNDSLVVYCPELSDLQEEALLLNQQKVEPSHNLFKTVPIVIDMMKQRAENSPNNQTYATFSNFFSDSDFLGVSPETKEAAKTSMEVIRSFSLLQFCVSVLLVFYGQMEEAAEE